MVAAYEESQTLNTPSPKIEALKGDYWNDDMRLLVEVYQNSDVDSGLQMRLNRKDSQQHNLTHYHHNTFGFLPKSRDEKELRCLVDYFIYEQFLISFIRDDSDKAVWH